MQAAVLIRVRAQNGVPVQGVYLKVGAQRARCHNGGFLWKLNLMLGRKILNSCVEHCNKLAKFPTQLSLQNCITWSGVFQLPFLNDLAREPIIMQCAVAYFKISYTCSKPIAKKSKPLTAWKVKRSMYNCKYILNFRKATVAKALITLKFKPTAPTTCRMAAVQRGITFDL